MSGWEGNPKLQRGMVCTKEGMLNLGAGFQEGHGLPRFMNLQPKCSIFFVINARGKLQPPQPSRGCVPDGVHRHFLSHHGCLDAMGSIACSILIVLVDLRPNIAIKRCSL